LQFSTSITISKTVIDKNNTYLHQQVRQTKAENLDESSLAQVKIFSFQFEFLIGIISFLHPVTTS
jgi:hypothetical protein